MKYTCKTCDESLDLSNFEKTPNGHRRTCKGCRRKYFLIHNKKRKDYIIESNRQRVKYNRTKLWEYFEFNPCVDCGEKDPVVLEFDHVRGQKTFAISAMASKTCKWETLEEEIKKCVVRCSNCHRRKTAKELGWYEYMK